MRPGQVSYSIRALLASGVLFYAVRLSASGRTLIDYTVLALVSLAILWNMVHLAERFRRADQPRDVWHLLRTVLFWVIGMKNTMLTPDTLQSWNGAMGAFMLLLAALDTIWIHRKERDLLDRRGEPLEQAS